MSSQAILFTYINLVWKKINIKELWYSDLSLKIKCKMYFFLIKRLNLMVFKYTWFNIKHYFYEEPNCPWASIFSLLYKLAMIKAYIFHKWFPFTFLDRALDISAYRWVTVDLTPLHPGPHDKVNFRNSTGESKLWRKLFRRSWIWINNIVKFKGKKIAVCMYA